MFILVVLIYMLIGIFEIVPMFKSGQRRELMLYIPLLLVAFTLSILLSIGVKIPSPAKPIETLVKMIIKI
jgi:hypothetical protein